MNKKAVLRLFFCEAFLFANAFFKHSSIINMAEADSKTEEESKPDDEAKTEEETKKPDDEAKPNEDASKALEEVRERLKFFFSDANIRQDYFIRKLLMKKDGEASGKVPIEALLRFNTIKQHTTDAAVVVQAAKALPDVLVLDEKETAIGRVKPFTNDLMDGNIPLSLYVRNLPIKDADGEAPQYDVGVDDIRQLFSKYGDVAIVKLKFTKHKDDQGDDDLDGKHTDSKKQRQKKRYPIGHAMVEFHEEQGMQRASDATLTMKGGEKQEPKEKLTLGNSELDVMLLKDYIDMRKAEKEKEHRGNNGKKRERETEDDEGDGHEAKIPTFEFDWKPGCVIKLKGLAETSDREAILDTIAKALDISVNEVKARNIYADYSRGQTEGAIRFATFDEAIAKTAERLKAGELEIAGAKVEDARVLDGDEEKKYWENFIDFKNKQIRHKEEEKHSRKKRRKGGRKH